LRNSGNEGDDTRENVSGRFLLRAGGLDEDPAFSDPDCAAASIGLREHKGAF
jgi:hypothetical protein